MIPWDHFDNTTNILDVYVYLHERIVRYLIGDNNIYDMDLHCVSRDRKAIDPDQVILPEGIKEKILKLAENYSANKSRPAKALVDQFYGYGTGLVFLFHGLSGTGKTMLAHALATHLDKELFSVDMEHASNPGASSEDLIKYLFKEAKLNDGIVFFDECDEVFRANTSDSRSLLIEIEKSDCITIMATNRVIEVDPALDRRITMKDLDAAAIRRFNHKLDFDFLTPEGNVIFYKKLLSPLIKTPLDRENEKCLKEIEDLSPGDFKTVRDRYKFYPERGLNHQAFVMALEEEFQGQENPWWGKCDRLLMSQSNMDAKNRKTLLQLTLALITVHN